MYLQYMIVTLKPQVHVIVVWRWLAGPVDFDLRDLKRMFVWYNMLKKMWYSVLDPRLGGGFLKSMKF